MAKNINYHGRTTPLPGTVLKHRQIAVPEWAVEDCWLHGGRYKKAECPGCVLNFESDRDQDGMAEAMGDEL
jgi:hypothetical protein